MTFEEARRHPDERLGKNGENPMCPSVWNAKGKASAGEIWMDSMSLYEF